MYKIKQKDALYEFLYTILGAFIMSVGIALFLLPNKLSSGGFSGIAIITYYFFKVPMGITIITLNTPLYLFLWKKRGKKFLIKSIVGTISLSIFIDLLENIKPIVQDRLLASVFGGIIIGVGTSLVFKANSSTGGSELLSYVVKTYKPHFKIGRIVIFIDIIIIIVNVIVFKEIEIGLYSAISIYLIGKMIDIVFEGINYTKMLIIVSDKANMISNEITKKTQRGVTGVNGKGMYKNEDKSILICAIPVKEITQIKEIINEIDCKSFFIIVDAREVYGKGFKN